MWAYSSKGVSIFPDNLHPHFRPDTLGSPATAGVINPAKTCLILKHQSELPPYLTLPHHLLFNYSRQFFLNADWVAASDLGWRGRGTILRQP